jgi:hypothetical protein
MNLTIEELNDLVFYTFRYCLGRKSYAVGDANKYIKKFIIYLSDKNLHIIQIEIIKELQKSEEPITNMAYGDLNAQWRTTSDCITEELERRNKEQEHQNK